jgi:trehalose 6-phosphate phosphatase
MGKNIRPADPAPAADDRTRILTRLARKIGKEISAGQRCWLFLDYDGTLAEFAPTPDDVIPDPGLIALLTRLARIPEVLRLVVLSGRKLDHLKRLVPVPGILIAGTYGIEVITAEGRTIYRLDFASNRPVLDSIKPQWEALIEGKTGFYLEEKGWSIALHAHMAEKDVAEQVLEAARLSANQAAGKGTFRILGGYRFLEVAPVVADKGQSVAILIDQAQWPGAKIIYIGDDDKDEQAFEVVKQRGGVSILTSAVERSTLADYRLESPQDVRQWLNLLITAVETEQSKASISTG